MRSVALSHVVIHGHSVGYRRRGEGETVLLLHGLAGSSRTWRAVLPELALTHDVIAPDLLGHGESAKPMGDYSLGAFASGLRDFLAALDVPRATIVGHSFGGGVAMQLAYQHPELCDRLVLVSSGGLGREVSWLLRLPTLPGAEQLMPLIFPRVMADRGEDIGRVFHRVGMRSTHLAELWRAYVSLAGAENRKAFVRTIRGVIEPGGQTVSALDRLYLAQHLPTLDRVGRPRRDHPREARIRRPRGHPRQPSRDPRRRRPLPTSRSAGAVPVGVDRLPRHDEGRNEITRALARSVAIAPPGGLTAQTIRAGIATS